MTLEDDPRELLPPGPERRAALEATDWPAGWRDYSDAEHEKAATWLQDYLAAVAADVPPPEAPSHLLPIIDWAQLPPGPLRRTVMAASFPRPNISLGDFAAEEIAELAAEVEHADWKPISSLYD